MKTVGILAFGALLVVAFSYFAIFGGSTESTVQQTQSDIAPIAEATDRTLAPDERQQFSGSDSIRSLYERGDSIECQITYIPNPLETEITGNIFTDEGRVRADFVVPSPDFNGQTVASIIYDQPTMYIWSEIDGETFGIEQTQEDFSGFSDSAAEIDYDTEVQYDCLSWPRVDNTIFEPPSNVLFKDAADMKANMEFGTLFEDENGELPL